MVMFWSMSYKQKYCVQLPESIFKGGITSFCFPSFFMSGWNVNLMARVPAAILDQDVTLGMEAEQSETTEQEIRDHRDTTQPWTDFLPAFT